MKTLQKIWSNSTRLCSKNGTIFHRGVVHQMSFNGSHI